MGRYISGSIWGQRPPRQLRNNDAYAAPALAAGVATTVLSIAGAGRLKYLQSAGSSSSENVTCQAEVLIDGVVVATDSVNTYAPGGSSITALVGRRSGTGGVSSVWDSIAFTRGVEVRITAPTALAANLLSLTAAYELH